MEPIPFELAIAAILICSGLALLVGFCLRPEPRPLNLDFRALYLGALKRLDELESPKLLPWTAETRERIRDQERRSYRRAA